MWFIGQFPQCFSQVLFGDGLQNLSGSAATGAVHTHIQAAITAIGNPRSGSSTCMLDIPRSAKMKSAASWPCRRIVLGLAVTQLGHDRRQTRKIAMYQMERRTYSSQSLSGLGQVFRIEIEADQQPTRSNLFQQCRRVPSPTDSAINHHLGRLETA